MEKSLNWREFVITRLIKASGYSAILFVALIFFFLLREGVPTFGEVDFKSLLSIRWYPIEDYFGILPLLTGSLIVTIGAGLIAVPFGIGTAVYISEIAPRWMREILKPLVELLGGLPSVVLGFLGILVLSPYPARLSGPANGSDGPYRIPAAGRHRRTHSCVRCRGCARRRAARLSGRRLGFGRDALADHLASDICPRQNPAFLPPSCLAWDAPSAKR